MRVLFITQIVDRTHPNLGAIHGWIAALAREVEYVHVLALATGVAELPPNVQIHSLGKDRGNGKPRQLQIFHSVAGGLALRRQVDIFFPHMVPRYALLVAPYRLIFRIPTVMWYAHNSADLQLRLANLCVDRFVSASQDSFPLGPAKCSVVGMGIDTDLFHPPDAAPPSPGSFLHGNRERSDAGTPFSMKAGQAGGKRTQFLCLGRISPRKELDTLISAADLLANHWKRRDVEIVVAGAPFAPEDHAYLDHLRSRVGKLNLEDVVRFAGGIPHSETASWVQTCDFFVNLHVEGGIGKSVLEAMSCGKPALVSTPTYYERFPQYGERFLFAPRSHESLAEKMREALDLSPRERIEIGQDLRRWVVESHNLAGQMSRVARVLREVRGG